MEDLVTVDKIISWLTEQIEKKNPIDGNTYMDAALKITVLLQGEQEKLFNLEQEVAIMRKTLLEDGKPAVHVRMVIESTEEYKKVRLQKAKIDRAIEFVRIAKLNSRLASDLMRSAL